MRVNTVAQVETLEQGLSQRAAAAFTKQGLARMELHARREIRTLLAVVGAAHIASRNALDRAIVVIEHFAGRETRIDLDLERGRLLCQPATDIAEADNVVAMIVHLRRCRQLERAALREKQKAIFTGRRMQRRAARLPVGDQFIQRARLDDCARHDVGTDLGTFLQHTDRQLFTVLNGELTQTDRRRQARRSSTHDHDVEFHRFAFHGTSPLAAHIHCVSAFV